MATQRSQLLDALYGEQESKRIYQMLESLDPTLNAAVQNVAYNYFWASEGISIRDKSLITIATLAAMNKVPQIRSHMVGFLNTGGSVNELLGALLYIAKIANASFAINGLKILFNILEKTEQLHNFPEIEDSFYQSLENRDQTIYRLTPKDQRIVSLATHVALCQEENIKQSIHDFLAEADCNETFLRNLLIHQIVYCGFPTVINAFSLLINYKTNLVLIK
jgi:4-carboxymuconolactone decarboxylase